MELSWAVFPWVCCAIFLATIILGPVVVRHPARLHDLQANMYLSRRRDVIAGAVVCVLIAVFSILFGVAFLSAGYDPSWGFFLLAGIPIFWMAFYAYIAALPFSFPEADEADPVESSR